MATRYATKADLAKYGLPPAVLQDIPDEDQDAAIDAASAMADDYLADIVDLPMEADSWPFSLRRHVAVIAGYDLLRVRGFNPEGSDKLIVDEYERAMKWLRDVSTGDVPFSVGVDPPAPTILSPPAIDVIETPFTDAANRKVISGF
jgi:phage gp36-like protein